MAGAGKSRDRRTRFIKESPSQGMILSLHWAEKIRKKKKAKRGMAPVLQSSQPWVEK